MRQAKPLTLKMASFWIAGFLGLAGLCLTAMPLRAQGVDLAAAQTLFNNGDFAGAAAAGQALDSAGGWALAARALLVEAAYLAPAPEKEADLLKAEAAARNALAKDPNNTEAMVHLVIALGYRVRIEGLMKAQSAGRAGETKALLDRALALEPQNPWANAALGGWNGQIVKSAGALFAKLLCGATLDQARIYFARAMALDPGNVSILVEYAKLLLNLNPGRYTAEALPLLNEALASQPKNAFEKMLLGQAQGLLTAIRANDKKQLAKTLKAVTPFSK